MKEQNGSSDSLTVEQCLAIFQDLVEWKELRPPEVDDPMIDGLLSLVSSDVYGGLLRAGFLLIKYNVIDQRWHVTITDEGLDIWRKRSLQ